MTDSKGKNIKYGIACVAALLALFAAEYVFFKGYVLREVAPYYPPNHDQAAFLREAYYMFENIRERGISELLRELFSPRAAQGKLLTTQGNVAFMLAGPSRLNALLPNLLYFFALQASVFYLLKRISARHAVSFAALGLILMLSYPFYSVGDLFDFRIDFQAFCLYGIFVSALALSNAFLSNRWTVAATVLGFLLALLRHVALGYIGGVYFIMLAFFSIVYFASGPGERRKETLKRIRNVIISGIAILAATFPFLWASRATIYQYYGVGHFLGKEKEIRSPGETIGTNVFFYLRKLHSHLGDRVVIALILLLAVGVTLLVYARIKGRKGGAVRCFSIENMVFLAVAAIAPFLVLITDLNKSPVVGAVMVTPVVLFCFLAFAAGMGSVSSRSATALLCVAAVALMALGLKHQHSRYTAVMPPEKRASLEDVTRLSLEIGDYCERNSLSSPAISFDIMRDYMTDGGMTILNYEARQRLLRFRVQLANSIFDISKDEAAAKLKASDVVVFSPDPIGGAPYPFDKAMDEMRPALMLLLESEFTKLKEYRVYNRTYYLFARPVGDAR